MRFKDFVDLEESGTMTSTSCVASFKRIIGDTNRRIFAPELGWIDPDDKKNPYRVPQVKENQVNEVLGTFGGVTGFANAGKQQTTAGKIGQAALDVTGISALGKLAGALADKLKPGWREENARIRAEQDAEAKQGQNNTGAAAANNTANNNQGSTTAATNQMKMGMEKVARQILSNPHASPEAKKHAQEMLNSTNDLAKSLEKDGGGSWQDALSSDADTIVNKITGVMDKGAGLERSTGTK